MCENRIFHGNSIPRNSSLIRDRFSLIRRCHCAPFPNVVIFPVESYLWGRQTSIGNSHFCTNSEQIGVTVSRRCAADAHCSTTHAGQDGEQHHSSCARINTNRRELWFADRWRAQPHRRITCFSKQWCTRRAAACACRLLGATTEHATRHQQVRAAAAAVTAYAVSTVNSHHICAACSRV